MLVIPENRGGFADQQIRIDSGLLGHLSEGALPGSLAFFQAPARAQPSEPWVPDKKCPFKTAGEHPAGDDDLRVQRWPAARRDSE
nr:hypothetical protein [Frankia sp. Mgl5]